MSVIRTDVLKLENVTVHCERCHGGGFELPHTFDHEVTCPDCQERGWYTRTIYLEEKHILALRQALLSFGSMA